MAESPLLISWPQRTHLDQMLVLCQHYKFTGQRRESEQATQDLFHLKYGIRTLGDDKPHYLEVERKGRREGAWYTLSVS